MSATITPEAPAPLASPDTAAERGRRHIEEQAVRRSAIEPTFACTKCHDGGWRRWDVLPGHPKFGQIEECPYCDLVKQRRAQKAAKQRGYA